MKKLALALAASTFAGQAFAADLIYPDPEPPVVFEPVFSWTGAYVGAQAGGSFNNGSDGLPGTFLFIPGIAAVPGTPGRPATPGTPASPGRPAIPATPATPGTPGSPAIPGTPGTPAVLGTVEFSCSAAGVGGAGAGSCAVEYPDGTVLRDVSYEELSAAYAAAGNGQALGVAGEATVVVTPATPGTPGTPAVPATPGTPATPGSPAVPATPAIPGTPAVPATPGTPGTPDQTVAYDFGPNTQSFSNEEDGFAVGGHVGYNYALNPLGGTTFVIGALADLSYVDITKGGGITDGFQTIGVEQELDYLATLRLKAGVGLDRFLVYGTGGLAFGDVETTITNTLFDATDSNSDTMVGYAVGAGTDYAVTDNFVLGLEYLYTNLGSDDFDQTFDLGGGKTLTTSADEDFDFHTVWAKASYRFN